MDANRAGQTRHFSDLCFVASLPFGLSSFSVLPSTKSSQVTRRLGFRQATAMFFRSCLSMAQKQNKHIRSLDETTVFRVPMDKSPGVCGSFGVVFRCQEVADELGLWRLPRAPRLGTT